MQVIFSSLARNELEDAIAFYDSEVPGLGARFKNEVREALPRICNWPHAWPLEHGEIRKYILPRFPYKLLYSIENDHLFIIAVAHLHRKPDYWVECE